MKKIAYLAVFVMLLLPVSALAGPQDFTLINASASNICYVYVSTANTSDWESDILGATQCLAPGEAIDVAFNAGNDAVWDLRVEDENGAFEDYRGFNLNTISAITIQGGGRASYQ